MERKNRTRRPRIQDEGEECWILREIKKIDTVEANNSFKKSCSPETVRNILRSKWVPWSNCQEEILYKQSKHDQMSKLR